MTPDHSPTPWEVVPSTENHGPYITSPWGTTLADLYCMNASKPHLFVDAHANATFIVRAVNNHDRLIAALRAVTDAYWGVANDDAGDGGAPPSMIVEARAALKAATS